ncbi:MAG: EI24 domain-containing protein [Alphaproteobacteria bacterium]|nr:EI24 domain-containing protein [Alphaproteobacteria bacterium]
MQGGTTPEVLSGSAFQRFSRGFRYPFRGFRYLVANPDLWGWVAVPAAINLALFVVTLISSWLIAPRMLGVVWTRPEEGLLLFAWWLTAWLIRLALMGIMGLGVYLAAGVLSAPFNEIISERVEQRELGDAAEPFTMQVFLRDTGVSIIHSLGALSIYAAIMAPLLVINLVPGVGSAIYMVVSWAVSGFFLAREMTDGVTSRRRMSFMAKFRIVRQHLALMEGFGVATNMLLWIPLVNFLCMPVSVIGGTLLYIDLERAGVVPARRRLPQSDHPVRS